MADMQSLLPSVRATNINLSKVRTWQIIQEVILRLQTPRSTVYLSCNKILDSNLTHQFKFSVTAL